MKVYGLVLCCTFFAAVAAFAIHDEVAVNSIDSSPSHADCNCKNGRCVKNNSGKMKCNCKPGYALQDESTCERCDCGKRGKCMFMPHPNSAGGLIYEKKCLCDLGSAEKDGQCVDCHCGEHSKCEFEGDEKICYCVEGFSEKNGVCTECDCGFYGECKFEFGHKRCTCDEGYVEKAGKCELKCGVDNRCQNGGLCEEPGICRCLEGTSGDFCEYIDKCDNLCPQQPDIECAFDPQTLRPFCECTKEHEGFHPETKECRITCNDGSHACWHGGECVGNGNSRFCNCLPGTEGELCLLVPECEVKDCGADAECEYDIAKRSAVCKCRQTGLAFDQEDRRCKETCDSRSGCRNGGKCDSSNFCRCLNGTAGDLCEKVPGCDSKFCGDVAHCIYDIAKRSAVCKCRQTGLAFDQKDRRCKETCDSRSGCRNGGNCDSSNFCRCLDGTAGDLCEKVPGCDSKFCGEVAHCIYDIGKRRAVCGCQEDGLEFDPVDFRCKRTCQSDSDCQNGAGCSVHGFSRFCFCLPGTNGDFCEKVAGCGHKDCGDQAACGFDASAGSAVCVCHDGSLSFDIADKTCKNTCRDSSVCKNGADCTGDGASKFCRCLRGTGGDFCENVIECDSRDCGHEARCLFDVPTRSAICKCKDRSLSFDTRDKTCKHTCQDSSVCKNGADCTGDEASKFCRCLRGTSGDFCENVIECGSKDCGHEARCLFDVPTRSAICNCKDRSLSFDTRDRTCKRTCEGDRGCENGGTCLHRMSSTSADVFYHFCDCLPGTSGDMCQIVDECARDQHKCKGGSRCSFDVDGKEVICRCPDEDKKYDPVEGKCKACDCGKNSMSCSFEQDKKICVCKEGFEGEDGTCKKKWCTEKNCFHGKCDVIDDVEVCSCYEGYELDGDYCRKMNCSKTACINGTCIVRRGNVEKCVCPAGYTLNRDTCIRGVCRIDTCYGGRCQKVDGELMCVCPDKFHLEGIGCYETVCETQHCFGGKCVVKKGEEICTCLEGYVLVRNVCKKIICRRNCFGGQCHIRNGTEECTCPTGYFLYEDVCREIQTRKQKHA